ncbi:unnamed protein product [Heterobilharzia americana]|nr:unnamed protein product [Heterobilharzia americana]
MDPGHHFVSNESDQLNVVQANRKSTSGGEKTVEGNAFNLSHQETESNASDFEASIVNNSGKGTVMDRKLTPYSPCNDDSLQSISDDTVSNTTSSQPNVRQFVLDYINPKTSNSGLELLKNRHKEYKLAALKARDEGELGKAKELLEASKCIGEAIVNIEAGKETFDPETDLPPPPSEFEFSTEENANETVAAPPTVKSSVPDVMKTPIVCKENILARITYYKEKLQEIAGDPSQESKKRRYTRILNRYEEGLRACERGITSFEFEELVPPPGYPPLTNRSNMSKGAKTMSGETRASLSKPSSGQAPAKSKSEAIVMLLTKRQDELKQAAKTAKQAGNIELAKTYIRSSLGMNQMIQAAEAGFPIDLTQLPRSPAITDSVSSRPILSGTKCDPPVKYAIALSTSSGDHLVQLYTEILSEQEKLISQLLNEHRRNGDQSIMSKLSDLMSVNTCIKKVLSKHSHQVAVLTPYFEYANLPKSNINAELGDDILEITVVRGIAYPLPSHYSHIDTYVDVELCFSSSGTPIKLSTDVVKSSCEPVYSQSVKEVHVNTKGRIYRRFVQNNRRLKATVYYNRGIFRSWGVLGVTDIPLTGLVQSSTTTHIGDLKDGRKVVGGRLEVQLRQRESLSGEPIIYQQQPWLLLSVSKQTDSPKTTTVLDKQDNSSSSSPRIITIKRSDNS